ncbi:MAG: hypothetical protein H0W48_00150 [Methylibium sp.]|nr:hypothetical protein [Methylibium sp.]
MKPRPVYTNAIQRAIESSRKLPADAQRELKAIVQRSRDEFVKQVDTVANWRALADALNQAEALAGFGICSDAESIDAIEGAQTVLSRVWSSHAGGGSWALFSTEITALDEGLLRHRIQLEHCSLGEYGRATKAVRNRVQAALAGNAGKRVTVLGGAA